MGRKIPGKKHHGVKDPLKQQAKRLEELKTKINAPPKNEDEQGVPKSLQRVIDLKNKVKSGKIVKKKRKRSNRGLIILGPQNNKLPHPKAKPEKAVPLFNQRVGETDDTFLRRVNRETENFLHETQFENKYNVQVKRNMETGVIEGIEKRPKDEIEELLKLKSKHKNIKKKKKVKKSEDEVRLTKSQKRKNKLEMRKSKKLQDQIDEFKTFKDNVAFGEVAHAPPDLKIRPRNADKIDSVRPVKKDLLLNSMLDTNKNQSEVGKKNINRSGKRKDLPVGERFRLEKQQRDAVAAYRLLKSRKQI
ncbi:coiled-coil domain-containing protein 137 [Leptopilina heterotoma]|uniref:coiled-coil domain-containing protein 137 n=1 Tax=Leptopilina heterotoma TaxID=63436 RepID=UPI001CA9524B|nr:coiled-coil domain-containing protein 137 [Leptopilina heterotoma]